MLSCIMVTRKWTLAKFSCLGYKCINTILRSSCLILEIEISDVEDCEGWWLSSSHSSEAEHWLYKPGVLGSIPSSCRPFHFPA